MSHGLIKTLTLILFIYSFIYSLEDDEIAIFYQDLILHPMDLNTTRIEYLNELLELPQEKILLFEAYRKNFYLTSIYELTNFGLSLQRIKEISPYIVVKNITNKEISLFFRYLSQSKNLLSNSSSAYALITVKDFDIYYGVKSYTNIVDETSANFISNSRYFLKYENDITKIIVGHYQAAFGQGLLFGNNTISIIDRIDSAPIYKKTRGFVEYKSLNDDSDSDGKRDYLEGFAINFNIKNSFFPFLSIANHLIEKALTTNLNITSGLIYKNDFEAGLVYNNLNRLTNQFSLFYDGKNDLFHPYGEVAYAGGLSLAQGGILRHEDFKLSALLYYSESNFNSTTSGKIIEYENDTKGIFFGFKKDFTPFYAQIYLDFYNHPLTNETIYQKYELALGLNWKNEIFSTLSIEAKSRYSELKTTKNIRNYIYLDSGFLKDRIMVFLRFQNLLELEKREMGNLFIIKIITFPLNFLKIKGRYNIYRAKSYYSALYYPEEPFYFGDFSPGCYYGIGSEAAIYIEMFNKEFLKLGCGYSVDSRKVENERDIKKERFLLYLEGEF